MGRKPIRLIMDDETIKLIKDAIILTIISVPKPRYCPNTTLPFEKALLLKKAVRMKISSILVARKAKAEMVSRSINDSMRHFLCEVWILMCGIISIFLEPLIYL